MGQDVPYNCDAPGGWGRALASPQRASAIAPFAQTRIAPCVRIAGDINHPDFRDMLDLLRGTANVTGIAAEQPDVVLIAQGRPGTFSMREIEIIRRAAPLAGIVALAGTWCEGEPRTGRPWPGVQRLYWYEFPSWWQRQLTLWAAGKCPDWARPGISELRISDCGLRTKSSHRSGTIVVNSDVRETADVLSDSLCRAGYATIWQRGSRSHDRFRGAIAGIWEGGQLNDREAIQLSTFCRQLSADGAPVLALLDFPRRDRVNKAISLGITAILGKPWLNADLITTLQIVTAHAKSRRAA